MAGTGTGIESIKPLLLEQALALWKRKWLAVATCWIICLAGWTVVWALPDQYQSNARAFIDVNGLLTPLLKGLVVDTQPSQSADYLRQTLLSRPNLEQVIYLANLAPPEMSSQDREQMITDLATQIEVQPQGQNLVAISYVNENANTAKNVVQALLTIFAERATASSRIEMDNARHFLDGQIANYEAQLSTAERRRADFRKKYADFFSPSGAPQLQVLAQQIAQYQQQIGDAQAGLASLAAQMKQVPAAMSVDASPTVTNDGQVVTAPPSVRLAQAERNLSALELEDTDKHPDVIAAKRVIGELRAQVASGQGGAEGRVQVPNPTYQSIKMKYVDTQTSIPILEKRLADAQAEYDRIKKLYGTVPDIEVKAQSIDRDYDLIKANYDELVKRRQAALLSQAADDQADRTQFRVIDPPEAPIVPTFPNRPLLYSLVLLLGLGGGIFVPLLLAKAKPTYSSVTSLRELGLPVIGAVGYVRHAGLVPFMRTRAGRAFVLSSIGLFAFYAALILISARFYGGIV